MKPSHLLQLVGLSAVWGTSFMLSRIAAPALGPNMTAWLRMACATVTLALLMRLLRQRWPMQYWRELALLGFVGVAGPHILFSWAALHMPAGYAALLYVTSVLFGAFASAWLKEDALTPAKIGGCLAGLAGAVLMVQLGPVQPTALLVLAALAASVGSALSGVSTVLMKRAVVRMEPLGITAAMHLLSCAMLLPGAMYDLPRAQFTAAAVWASVAAGVAISALAWWLFARLMRHVTPVAAMSSTFLSTGFGVLWGALFLHEEVGMGHLVGGVLILASCVMVTGFNPWRPRVAARPGSAG